MVCIYCGHKTKVANSRSSAKSFTTWRRRQCLNCQSIYSSREYPDLELSVRVKYPSGALSPFLRDMLFMSVNRSVSHRKTALEDSSALTDTIIQHILAHKSRAIVEINEILTITYSALSNFDHFAGEHYLTHHKR